MRVLAIETVGSTGTVALLERDLVVAELALDPALRSAQSLAPGIHELMQRRGWTPGDIELVAVASGPGSFTGLRIGVTTAKVFAYAVGCSVIGVNTMAAIASRVPEDIAQFSVILDAQRSELFIAEFVRGVDGQLLGRETTRVVSAEHWIAELPSSTIVTGPGLAKWSPRLKGRAILVDAARWAPAASAVGRVGWQEYAAGARISPIDLVPQYFRRTAAEEQWDRKGAL